MVVSQALGEITSVVEIRNIISSIRIVSHDSLGMPRSRQCPREYFSAAIGEPARNVFSRKVLHLDGLGIVLHLHRPYRADLWYGGSFSDIIFAFTA
jgi:hypothetical protein